MITLKEEKELISWIRTKKWNIDSKTYLRSFICELEVKSVREKLGVSLVKVTEYRPGQGGVENVMMSNEVLSVGSDVMVEVNKERVWLKRRSMVKFEKELNVMEISKSCVDKVNGFDRLRGVRYSVVSVG